MAYLFTLRNQKTNTLNKKLADRLYIINFTAEIYKIEYRKTIEKNKRNKDFVF